MTIANNEDIGKIAGELFASIQLEEFIRTHDLNILTPDEQDQLLDLYEAQKTSTLIENDEIEIY